MSFETRFVPTFSIIFLTAIVLNKDIQKISRISIFIRFTDIATSTCHMTNLRNGLEQQNDTTGNSGLKIDSTYKPIFSNTVLSLFLPIIYLTFLLYLLNLFLSNGQDEV